MGADLVGARRPTVSTALAELARDGRLVRRDDGTWLLTGEPIAGTDAVLEVIRQRRRLMPEIPDAPLPEPEPEPAAGFTQLDGLHASLDALRETASRELRAAAAGRNDGELEFRSGACALNCR